MENSIFISLNVIAIVNIAMLVAFLTLRKDNARPNVILAVILAIPGLYFADNILICSNTLHHFPYVFFSVQILANLFPVSVYYYVHLLLGDRKKYQPVLLTGTALTIGLSLFVLVHFTSLKPMDQLSYLNQLSTDNYPVPMTVYNLVFYGWQMVYLIVLKSELKQYHKHIKDSLASLDGVKYNFVNQFVLVLVILNLSLLVLYVALPTPIVDYGMLPVVVTIIYVFITVFLLKNNAILNRTSYAELEQQNEALHIANSDHVDIERFESRFAEIALKMDDVLVNGKMYLNPKFRLSDLAEAIGEPEYLTSKCLNKYYALTFYDLVNKLRIEKAKELLKTFDSKVDKIETIGYESGFNSRASFYRSFKKIEGKSPLDFVSSS